MEKGKGEDEDEGRACLVIKMRARFIVNNTIDLTSTHVVDKNYC